MSSPRGVLELFDLDAGDDDTFVVGPTPEHGDAGVYGGRVLAQCLWAATRTVTPDRQPHSLHGYFLRAGVVGEPTAFRVARVRDGCSFSVRRIEASQQGKEIFTMLASFHVAEDGPRGQAVVAPLVPGPEACPLGEGQNRIGFDVRDVPPPGADAHPTRLWTRAPGVLPDDPTVHACLLAYASDLYTGLWALEIPGGSYGPSLDHAMWFHRPVRVDEWVLMAHTPWVAAGARGTYAGSLFDERGVLVASIAQEMLHRG